MTPALEQPTARPPIIRISQVGVGHEAQATRILERAEPDPRPLVIYHADCNDGLTAAWALSRYILDGTGQEPELFPAKYQTPPPNVAGRTVVIADFSYKRPVLLQMAKEAKTITILDHHKSAEEDLRGIEDECPNLTVCFDMDRSGAGIAWDWCWQNHLNGCTDTPDGSLECICDAEPRPWFVSYVEDNDLWRHKMLNCKAVMEYIRSFPPATHFEMYDRWWANVRKLHPKRPGSDADMIADQKQAFLHGDAILRAKQVMVDQSLTFSRRQNFETFDTSGVTVETDGDLESVTGEMTRESYSALIANVPFFLSSDVAGALAERNLKETGVPLGITYYQREDGRWSLSFRSIGDYDVSKLALKFGGGGHRNAAGATVSYLPWQPLKLQFNGTALDAQSLAKAGDIARKFGAMVTETP